MKHQIQNKNFSVEVNETGAELCSFKSKETGLEYVWQGDKAFWGSTAPVLFPIIGALKNGEYTHKGNTFSIPKHGFIRNNKNLEIKNKTENSITFFYASTEELKKDYPFDFEFEITFTLSENTLNVAHLVANTGKEEMLFSLGGHPAFNCPFLPNENYGDYYLEFDEIQDLNSNVLSSKGLLTDTSISVVKNSLVLPLTKELFANDALIFKGIDSKKVTLKSKKHSKSISLTYPDFSNLGIWAKYQAPFVCIEPWLGVTDHENATGVFKEKDGIIILPFQEKYQAMFSIEIN
jgi:galactose mutarotase-like enzyme